MIKAVLSRLGFNPHMPRAVVHASTKYGGIGLLDLYTEQGCSLVLTILSHLRYGQYLYKPIITLIESYIILAGITTSPFIQTDHIQYVSSPWIATVCGFLHKHSIQIVIPKLHTINLLRKFDQPIMIHCLDTPTSKSESKMFNACRLFFQVTTLSEITNHQGTKIIPTAYTGELLETGKPKIHSYSKSKLNGPYQENPSRKAWSVWKRYLTRFTTETGELWQSLGPWNTNVHNQRTWYYLHLASNILHLEQ
jgi:hypothetical protein